MKNISLLCYHFWNKLNLNYLSEIKKQSSTHRLWIIAMSDVALQFICLSICFSTMLSIASKDSLVDKLTLISDLNDWLVLDDQVCESSTCSNRINLSNILNNDVCIVFLWYGEIKLNLENLEKKVNTWKEKVWNFTKNKQSRWFTDTLKEWIASEKTR